MDLWPVEKKKYNHLENILQKINQKYISLPQNEVKRNNIILEQVLDPLTTKMKEKNVLFKNMFEKKFYGGSFYDGIKVGNPTEYDLDCVLNLPLVIEPEVVPSHIPGFVHIKAKAYDKLLKQKEASKYDKLEKLFDSLTYMSTEKVLRWMEGTITLALHEFPLQSEGYTFHVLLDNGESMQMFATVSKSHPAFTLKLKNKEGTISFDVDLVPCFQFTRVNWPRGEYRENLHLNRNKFFVVPKNPPGNDNCINLARYWRLSFQEQEREIITGGELKSLKPAIRLLKKLRDQQKHQIASYFIKTIFLWEVDKQRVSFWSQPLSYVFITMLKRYTEMIQNKCIPYYWNKGFNLIGHIKPVTLSDIGNALKNIIDRIDKCLDEPFIVAEYLIFQNDIEDLKKEVHLSKKFYKKLPVALTSSSSTSTFVDWDLLQEPVDVRRESNPEDESLTSDKFDIFDDDGISCTSFQIINWDKTYCESSSSIANPSPVISPSSLPALLTDQAMKKHKIVHLDSDEATDVGNASDKAEIRRLQIKITEMSNVISELQASNKNILSLCTRLNDRLSRLEEKDAEKTIAAMRACDNMKAFFNGL